MKVFMVPLNSLILYDLIERFGHEPLSLMSEMRDRVVNAEIEAPPLNLTPDDVKVGLIMLELKFRLVSAGVCPSGGRFWRKLRQQ